MPVASYERFLSSSYNEGDDAAVIDHQFLWDMENNCIPFAEYESGLIFVHS